MPLDNKSNKRVKKLFSDIERIANEPTAAGAEHVESQPPDDTPQAYRELNALSARIQELEAQLKQSEARASVQAALPSAPAILYEKEQVGYFYQDNELSPVQITTPAASKTENAINAPLIASGQTVGEIQLEPPSDHAWTEDESNLANAVAQQASLQIQNLRLLTATERARAEAQAATRRFTHENWEAFMDGIHQHERIGFAYDQASVQAFTEATPDEHDLQETVNVMDEQVGSLFLKADPAHPLSDEDRLMVSAVARQLGQQVENLRLLADASRARADAEEATRRLSHENWQSYTSQNPDALGFAYDTVQVTPFEKSQLPQDISFAQPLMVRGEAIGQLTVAGLKDVSPGALELANSIAEQVSVHIESLRLFEQTEKSRSELQQGEARLRTLVENAPEAIVVIDLNTGLFTQPNENAVKLYGLSRAQLVKVGPAQMSPPAQPDGRDSTEKAMEKIGEAVQGGTPVFEWIHRNAQGRDFPCEVRLVRLPGDHPQIRASVTDITERKRDQAIIAQRAIQLETVAAVSATASTVLNPDELLQQVVDLTKERFNLYHAQIYLADESWKTLLLASGAGEIGRQMVSEGWAIPMNHEQSIAASAARNMQFVIANHVVHDKESDFLSNRLLPETRSEMAVPMIVGEKLLGIFDVQADTANFFTEEDANIYNTLAVQVAIALQNARLYVEQSATMAQLRELDRLKTSFLANMSHELRTPLNSILGFSDVMLEELDGPLTENMANDLGLIQKNGQHLLHLINDVLDMAKIESGKMNLSLEKFAVQEILEEVTSITAPLASEKNLALFIENESDQEVEISADRTRLRQVMINIVNNAIKFTEKGKISIRVTRQAENVLIAVRDTGIGIPSDKLEAVFQEFTQVDASSTRKAGGTGLGLPISRKLVKMHGGKMWAESAGVDGQGATFFVELPIEAQLSEPEEKTSK